MSQKKKKRVRKQIEQVARKATEMLTGAFGKLEFRKTIRENIFFLLLMTVGIVAVYINGMAADFVSDDYATILNNPELLTWKYAFQGGASTYMINSIVGRLFGVTPIPFHLTSLLLYLVTCWLAFVFVYYFNGKLVSYITMSIFAVHPIHVEAVTWISGKPYILIAMYVLAATLMFIKAVETQKAIYLVGAGVAFVLAFLTDNPRPFSLFPIILLYLVVNKVNLKKVSWFRYWPLALIAALVVAGFTIPHAITRIGIVNSGYNSSESVFYNPLFQYPTGMSKYFQLLLVPIDLTLYHTMYILPVWLNWLIFLNYIALVIYFWFKDKRYFLALSFIFVAVFPSISPVKVSWLVAERYMFLGSLGFCIFLGLILNEIWGRSKYIAAGILSIILVLFSVRLVLRNIDWQTNHKLWVNTCQVSPNSHNAWNNIGDDYDKLKQLENAVKGFTQSTVIKPNYADAYHNRANILFKMQRLDLARDSYLTALHFSPGLYQTYLSLINIDLMERKLDLALADAQKALSLQPNDPTTNFVLAVVYAERNEKDKAIPILESINRAYPNFKQAKDALMQLKSGT